MPTGVGEEAGLSDVCLHMWEGVRMHCEDSEDVCKNTYACSRERELVRRGLQGNKLTFSRQDNIGLKRMGWSVATPNRLVYVSQVFSG